MTTWLVRVVSMIGLEVYLARKVGDEIWPRTDNQ